jgi:hypothetical protein
VWGWLGSGFGIVEGVAGDVGGGGFLVEGDADVDEGFEGVDGADEGGAAVVCV